MLGNLSGKDGLKAEGKENIDHGGLVQYYEKIFHVVVQKKTMV